MERVNFKRGEIYLAELPTLTGTSVQGGKRPVVIVQNDKGNMYSPVITALPITSQTKRDMPTHVKIGDNEGLMKESVILGEQILTISKQNLIKKIGNCSEYKLKQVEMALLVQLGMIQPDQRERVNSLNYAIA